MGLFSYSFFFAPFINLSFWYNGSCIELIPNNSHHQQPLFQTYIVFPPFQKLLLKLYHFSKVGAKSIFISTPTPNTKLSIFKSFIILAALHSIKATILAVAKTLRENYHQPKFANLPNLYFELYLYLTFCSIFKLIFSP